MLKIDEGVLEYKTAWEDVTSLLCTQHSDCRHCEAFELYSTKLQVVERLVILARKQLATESNLSDFARDYGDGESWASSEIDDEDREALSEANRRGYMIYNLDSGEYHWTAKGRKRFSLKLT